MDKSNEDKNPLKNGCLPLVLFFVVVFVAMVLTVILKLKYFSK